MGIELLDEERLLEAVEILADRDPDLASVVRRHGPPPLWARPPGFPTLIRIILEQQVSLSSAKAAYDRLVTRTGEPTPETFLELSDGELRGIGFSRQKARYVRLLAGSLLSGSLDLGELEGLGDDEARGRLMELKGIGRWSADIYLLMALRRPDVWPRSDLALINAVARIKGLVAPPSPEEFDAIGEAWRPWRSAAARIAWFEYLGGKP
jgi:DNA-3-methyladenine glycosylase II